MQVAAARLPRRSCWMPRRGLAATLSYEELLVIAGALSVTSAASMIFNLLQHRKMQVYKSAEEGILLREKVASSREELFKKSEQHLQVQLEAMTQRALINNNESFLNMATHAFSDMQRQAGRDLQQTYCDIGHIVAPLQKSLDQVGLKMDSMEKERAHSFTDLRRQVIDLISSQKELRTETASLVKALRSPTGRGQWGEMQLRRVIEIAGMVEHCDFVQQKQLAGNEDGPGLRPDVVVRLSGGRCVVVDAKTPLLAYLEAHDCKDEDIKLNLLKDHARHLKTHINNLSQKSYWSQLEVSPDFVVLFVPGEAIFGAALTADPTLIEYGVERRVMLATPTTLISLLRVVALGWQQQCVADNARQIGDLGKEFYKRLSDYSEHLENVGKHLTNAVNSYNQSVGSFEKRVLVSARKFQQLDPRIGGDSAEASKEKELRVSEVIVNARQVKRNGGD